MHRFFFQNELIFYVSKITYVDVYVRMYILLNDNIILLMFLNIFTFIHEINEYIIYL